MSNPAGLLVTPGASADRENRTLVALEEGLALPVERITIRGRAVARVHAQLRDDVAAFGDRLGVGADRLVLGGRSFGGRMCSMLAARPQPDGDDPATTSECGGLPVAGLVLLSYPLHPPGKPDRLRTAHFPGIEVPVLFVSGTRDPFATPDELTAAAEAIPGPVDFAWIDGQGHSPRDDAPVVAAVSSWLADRGAGPSHPRG